jgi:hypothetical protein
VSYSEQFDNAYWNLYQATITANDTISPDGTQNADKFVSGSGPTNAVVYKNFGSISAGSQTTSVYFKAGTAIKGFLQIYDGTTIFAANYNTSTGLVENLVGAATASMQNMGNGWWRCVLTATTLGATHYMDYGIFASSVGDYGYVWGAQFETQSSYPTSYIPSTSASATRVADACSKTGISSLIGQTEGTLFAEIDYTLNTESAGIIGIDAGSLTFAYLFIGASNALNFNIYNAGSPQAAIAFTLPSSGKYKIAGAYKANDFVLYVNGVQRNISTSGTVPACSILSIDSTAYGLPPNSKHSQLALFKTRLTNAELASLTTL